MLFGGKRAGLLVRSNGASVTWSLVTALEEWAWGGSGGVSNLVPWGPLMKATDNSELLSIFTAKIEEFTISNVIL